MLKAMLIGNLGADAEVKSSNGREFLVFRVAHTTEYNNADGTTTSNTIWVDCIYNNGSAVREYLKRGTQVYVEGTLSLRVYSSAKDRCMKAGMTIHVQTLQLIGGKVDAVPKEVINPDDGSIHNVSRVYLVTDMNGVVEPDKYKTMVDAKGNEYVLDTLGFIKPYSNPDAN